METGKRTQRFVFPIASPSSTFAHLSQPLIRSQNRYPSTLPNRLSNTSNPLSLKLAQTKKISLCSQNRSHLSLKPLSHHDLTESLSNKQEKQRLLQNRKLTLGPLMKMTAQGFQWGLCCSKAIGTAIGCVVAPLTFFLFYHSFDVGDPNGEYKAPYAIIYRNMAILGVEGFSALPNHCLEFCYAFFAFAVLINFLRDWNPKNIGKWVPFPMAMAVPFVVGAYFAVDMCVGSLVVFVWSKLKRKEAELMVPAVASGLICGDGIWVLPSAILAWFKVRPPICMSFAANN